MDPTGEYQKNISDMDYISDTRYENIFKVFLKSNKYIYNILKSVHIDVANLPNSTFTVIKTPVEIPFTTLSFNFYGTMDVWWLIYIVNKDKFKSPLPLIPGGTDLRMINVDRVRDIIDQISIELEPPS